MPRPDVEPALPGRLRALREDRGRSLRELARLALSSKSHVHQFEQDTKVPGPDTLRRLDEVLAGGELIAMVTVPRCPRHRRERRRAGVPPPRGRRLKGASLLFRGLRTCRGRSWPRVCDQARRGCPKG